MDKKGVDFFGKLAYNTFRALFQRFQPVKYGKRNLKRFRFFLFVFKEVIKVQKKIERISINAILIALSVVFERFLSVRIPFFGVETLRIGIGALPIFIAGFLFEPTDALIVGALADIVGYLISPMGAYMPQFTLTSALTGWIPAITFKYVFKRKLSFIPLLVSIGIGQFVTDIVMVPYFIHTLFGVPYAVLMPGRLIGYPIMLFVYPFLALEVMKRMPQRKKCTDMSE